MAKDFLTPNFLGSGAGVSDRAGFRLVSNDYIAELEAMRGSMNVFPTM